MIQDSTKKVRRSRSATAANDIAKTGSPTNADQLDVQIHLALTATRHEFRAARIAAMKWELTDEG
jgi:hypothetical protein